jgi:hypothetical protein
MARLSMKRGDTRRYTITVTRNGAPEDISSPAELWFTAKTVLSLPDSQATIQKTTVGAGGITVTDGPGGIALLTIDPADTSALTADAVLSYDVQLKTSSADIETIDAGELRISLDATVDTA